MTRVSIILLVALVSSSAAAQQKIESPYLNAPWGQADIDRLEPYRERWRKVWDYIQPPPEVCKLACAYYPGVDIKLADQEKSLAQIEQLIKEGKLKRWYGDDKSPSADARK